MEADAGTFSEITDEGSNKGARRRSNYTSQLPARDATSLEFSRFSRNVAPAGSSDTLLDMHPTASKPATVVRQRTGASRPHRLNKRIVPRSAPQDWVQVAATGETKVVSGPSKSRLAATLGLHARDLRFLDPALSASYPAAILDRENAILVNLDFIKVIITTEFVIIVNPGAVDEYQGQRKMKSLRNGEKIQSLHHICDPLQLAAHHWPRMKDEYVPQLITSMKEIARFYTRSLDLPHVSNHSPVIKRDSSSNSGSHHHHHHHHHPHHSQNASMDTAPDSLPSHLNHHLLSGSGSEGSGSPPDKRSPAQPSSRRASHEKGLQIFNSLLHRSMQKGSAAAGSGAGAGGLHQSLSKVAEHMPTVRSYQGLAEMATKLGFPSAAGATVGAGAIELPFELKALEVCLEMMADHIQQDAAELEAEGYPAVDELMQMVGFEQLDRVRLLKNKLSRATARTKTILKLLQAFLDDDMDMHRLNLTAEELSRQGSILEGMDGIQRQRSSPFPMSGGASPQSPPSFPYPALSRPSLLSRHSLASSSTDSSGFNSEDVAEIAAVEMLLEAYFMHVDKTWHRLETLDEYIKDTEDLVNTKQDKKRNLLTLLNLIFLALFGALSFMVLITGLFTMNLDNTSYATGVYNPDAIQSQPGVFNLVTGLSTAGGIVFFVVVVIVCYIRKLLF